MMKVEITPAAAPREGTVAKLVVTPGGEELDKHRHDVVGALARVQAIRTALANGYRFDDAAAARYLQLFDEAIGVLRGEVALLEQVYRPV